MNPLELVEMPLDRALTRRWNSAILGALRLGLTHTADCPGRLRNARPMLGGDCPWCEHVAAQVHGAVRNGKAAG